MALIEEFDKQGNFLFRWRTYVPGVILISAIAVLPTVEYWGGNYDTNVLYTLGCFIVSLFGLFIRCLTIGITPARTSGRNTKEQVADVVNQTGIYSTVRHPLYLGNFFMYLGAVFLTQSIFFSALYVLFFYLYYERIMFAEEFFLRNKFTKGYLDWANSTPAFIPSFKNYKKASLPFSFRNIIKREYPGLFGLVVVFTLFDIAILYFNETGRFAAGFFEALRIEQIVFFLIGLAFYIVVRLIVKTTKWLHVEGR
ncbi:lipid A Kdo2 1-phosphate O-methyltransferase [Leptospira sp. GIMC2001]|uniref:lipid A Kdo2 1-phosphate O-methyltransferase n=1 Tax=Leptospira sp. GIMC2001 TaxID=1513297 RepID=UPI0023496D74|nr:lipid A Kdo2 1-phosphate O-methyltransferase [Leptospira sp. GIMC2001]WCL48420.1 lipid A Kdo2 1-phosphate O-methyltransferase [Leptospira sp. GIMC2001]